MKIKKLGHCCLVIETKGKRILTDPGTYSTMQDEERDIDIVLITHEHGDHFHVESVKKILANNPNAIVITNGAVGKLLDAQGITYQVLEHGGSMTIVDVLLEGYGAQHALIYKDLGQVQNTGYFVDDTLFYPGDAFTKPGKSIDILALPVAGPWMKISEAVEYALALKPRVVFPVHDGILKNVGLGHAVPSKILPENDIEFVAMSEGDEREF
jgi:L-ascorbate metabolism protein UlaG (beta-lactamase superfamily)